MKRLIMLAVLCAFVLSAAAASAADIKATAEFKSDAVWASNWQFDKDNDGASSDARAFEMAQRLELTFDFIASENLKAVFTVRANQTWGAAGSGSLGAAPTDALQIRKSYLDFNWPGTAVNAKVGFQAIALPSAVGGSMLLDSRATALIVSSPITDNVALAGGMIRASNGSAADDDEDDRTLNPVEDNFESQVDMYVGIVPMTFGDFGVTPFVVWGNYGGGSGVNGAYWFGVASTMAFGDFNFGGDLNYGKVKGHAKTADASGWYLGLQADYAGLDMMTPQAFFVYTTGNDDKAANGEETMPTIAGDWAVGSFWFGGDAWLNGSINADVDADNLGFWALGLNLKNIASFAEGLFHQATIMYVQGTNDKKHNGTYGKTLTEKDSVIELDFNTYYKVYDALTIGLELGYISLNADEDLANNDGDGGSAYKIATGLKYKF